MPHRYASIVAASRRDVLLGYPIFDVYPGALPSTDAMPCPMYAASFPRPFPAWDLQHGSTKQSPTPNSCIFAGSGSVCSYDGVQFRRSFPRKAFPVHGMCIGDAFRSVGDKRQHMPIRSRFPGPGTVFTGPGPSPRGRIIITYVCCCASIHYIPGDPSLSAAPCMASG